ncbi:MAG: GAF domain-containing protein [Phycisphaerae bacterium]|nr:GAF domain-containing protein [Phycisphaerae bacterium]
MNQEQKQERYDRIIGQLSQLLEATEDPVSRMATVSSLLYHKMRTFFWIGFYRIINGELLVGPYQGSIACQKLQKDTGVCWACVNRQESVIVADVEKFPGHIACDSRSKSEIVIPVRNPDGEVVAVLDADSEKLDTYDEIDEINLQTISDMIYGNCEK